MTLWIWSFHWSISPAGCFSGIKQTWTTELSGIRWCSSIWVCLQEKSPAPVKALVLGAVWATQWSSGSLKRVRGSLLFYCQPPFLFLCKRSLMEVSLVQQKEHWWFCPTLCNCSVSVLQPTSHQWPSHSPRGQGYWVAFRKGSCSLTNPAVAVKSSVYWALSASLSSKAPHTCMSLAWAQPQSQLSFHSGLCCLLGWCSVYFCTSQ